MRCDNQTMSVTFLNSLFMRSSLMFSAMYPTVFLIFVLISSRSSFTRLSHVRRAERRVEKWSDISTYHDMTTEVKQHEKERLER